MTSSSRQRLCLADLHREPFRLFFPLATLAGFIGVLLWIPLLMGWSADYPGAQHARLMVQGFFAGFMFGFLGTSMPRLLEVPPLRAWEASGLLALLLVNIGANALGHTAFGDVVFALELALWFSFMKSRCHVKRDLPPPSFVLVGLSFGCGLAGTVLHLAARRWEFPPELELLARLLSYHAFVLLCILGAGGFLLPRFLDLGLRRTFATASEPTPEWQKAACVAGVIGALLIATYTLEAAGWPGVAVTFRALGIVSCLAYEMPIERLRFSRPGVQWLLVTGLLCVPVGVLASGWWPGLRLAMAHIELIGGFALITLGVATRVVFGHSGERAQLDRFHPVLTVAAALMLLGLLNRLSGDLVPSTTVSHYFYGALCWLGGLLLWSVRVLPNVLKPDPDE